MLIGLYIAVTGDVPLVTIADVDRILASDLAFVFIGGLCMFLVSYVFGFAADIKAGFKKE